MREAGPEHNVVSFLKSAAERLPDRMALISDGHSEYRALSFRRLWELVDRFSAGLKASGFLPGQRAAVMVPMSTELYVVLLGVLKAGGVAVFVDPWMGLRRSASLIADIGPSAYIGSPRSHLLRFMDAQLRRIPLSVTTGRSFARCPARMGLDQLLEHRGDGVIYAAAEDDTALVTFTSGSSGRPKGADRTHGFLAAQHRALCEAFPTSDEDVDMPMFPIFALSTLARGVTAVVPSMDFRRVAEVDPVVILRQMVEHGVTTSTASPTFFDRLAAGVASEDAPATLRRILTGGAPVTDGQLRTWRSAFPQVRVVVAYGSTEAEPIAHIEMEERLAAVSDVRPRTPGYCVGRPVPGIAARLIRITHGPVAVADGDWSPLEAPAGGIGELVVSGEHVCTGYYGAGQDEAENKIRDGSGLVWHRMGDTAYFDGEGRLWLVGRVHSTIQRGERMLHAQLVEQAARSVDERIKAAALVAVGKTDRAVVVLRIARRDRHSASAICDAVVSRLAHLGMEVDEVVSTSGALPTDPRHNAKIEYGILRRLIETGRLR